MIVATDGRDPGGDLGAAIAAAHRAGVEVDVLPVGDDPPIDLVSVRGLAVPRIVRAGDTLDVGVEMNASRDADVSIAVAIDGEERGRTDATARRGDSATHVSVTFPEEEGVHEVTVALGAAGDVNASNNVWRAASCASRRRASASSTIPRTVSPRSLQVLEQGGMRVEVPDDRRADDHRGARASMAS
jgi:hypothetical protein